jgi:hypothetical protein
MCCQTPPSSFPKSLTTNDCQNPPPRVCQHTPPDSQISNLPKKRAPSSSIHQPLLLNCQRTAPDSRRPGLAARPLSESPPEYITIVYTTIGTGKPSRHIFLKIFLSTGKEGGIADAGAIFLTPRDRSECLLSSSRDWGASDDLASSCGISTFRELQIECAA